MKLVLSLLFLGWFSVMNAQNFNYRSLIGEAEKNKANAEVFLNKVSAEYTETQKPIYLALRGAGNFFMAKHVGNPITKLAYFKKGKNDMENAVKKDSKNLEIRFLRYISQSKIPSFLGYNSNLKEDLAFLKENYLKSNNQELVNQIKKHIN